MEKSLATKEQAFRVLENVAQGIKTRWQIVYNSTSRCISFRTSQAPAVKRIDFRSLDFTPDKPVQVLDIMEQAGGDVSERLNAYSTRTDLDLINATFSATRFLKDLPEPVRKLVARYPEDRCQAAAVEELSVDGGE